jgi:trigger factor
LKVEKEPLGSSRWQLQVEVPADEIWADFDQELLTLQKETALPGFRRGKVPLAVLRQKFTKSVEADMLRRRLFEFYEAALREAGLDAPLSSPRLDLVQAELGKPLIFKAMVETVPPIELANYEGLTVVRERVMISDEAINRHIERLRERQAVLHDDPSPAGPKSLLEVDLQELDSAHLPVIGHKRENVLIDLSKSSPDFRQSLLGIQADQSRNVAVLKPPATPSEEKKYDHFQVTVKAIKRIELPELDDDFARSVDTNLKDYSQLREVVRNLLQNEVDSLAYQRVAHLLVHQIVDNSRLDVPEGMLNDYLDRLVEDASRRHQPQDGPFDHQLYRDRSRSGAEWNLKWYLLRKNIAEKEGLTVPEEEFETEYQRLAAASRKPLKEIKATFAEGRRREQIQDDLIERKVLQLLISKARVIDRTVTDEEFFAKAETEHRHS